MHDNMKVGASIFADGPNGRFNCIEGAAGPYLFLSGRSGVTPVMSMARWLCDTAPSADIHFVHFARSPEDLIFEQELRLMERRHADFGCEYVCSRADAKNWSGRSGHISLDLLSEIVPDFRRRAIYLCGPVGFMTAVRGLLETTDYDMARFAQESFGGAPRPAAPSAAPVVATPAKIVFNVTRKTVECTSEDYVLDTAQANGVDAACSCRAGQSASARSRSSRARSSTIAWMD